MRTLSVFLSGTNIEIILHFKMYSQNLVIFPIKNQYHNNPPFLDIFSESGHFPIWSQYFNTHLDMLSKSRHFFCLKPILTLYSQNVVIINNWNHYTPIIYSYFLSKTNINIIILFVIFPIWNQYYNNPALLDM